MKVDWGHHAELPLDQPPGTPFVVQDSKGAVVAAGLRLSAPDAANQGQRAKEAGDWLKTVGANADTISHVTNLVSAGIDVGSVAYPGLTMAPGVHAGIDVLAFLSSGASLVNAANRGDSYKATQFSITCGAGAIRLIADSGVFGQYSGLLHGLALATQFGKEAYVAQHDLREKMSQFKSSD
jgi:hypothetical protein